MRALELVAVLLFLLAAFWVLSALARQWTRRQAMRGSDLRRWHEAHQLEAGGARRAVFVEREGERERVGFVLTSATDYEDRFHELMSEARERAAMLNSESA